MEELRHDNEISNATCLNEFNSDSSMGNSGFTVSNEEFSSKPATVLTALFSDLGLPIEYVPRAIRQARNESGNGIAL
jgi:hypothetical protein